MSHAAREKWVCILEQYSHSVIRASRSGSPDKKVCTCVCVCMFVSSYVCVCLCACVYMCPLSLVHMVLISLSDTHR